MKLSNFATELICIIHVILWRFGHSFPNYIHKHLHIKTNKPKLEYKYKLKNKKNHLIFIILKYKITIIWFFEKHYKLYQTED